MWLGVSVEDRAYGLPRIDQLRQVNARIRFLSVEPLLEDLGDISLALSRDRPAGQFPEGGHGVQPPQAMPFHTTHLAL